jgi:hypothetical protein
LINIFYIRFFYNRFYFNFFFKLYFCFLISSVLSIVFLYYVLYYIIFYFNMFYFPYLILLLISLFYFYFHLYCFFYVFLFLTYYFTPLSLLFCLSFHLILVGSVFKINSHDFYSSSVFLFNFPFLPSFFFRFRLSSSLIPCLFPIRPLLFILPFSFSSLLIPFSLSFFFYLQFRPSPSGHSL